MKAIDAIRIALKFSDMGPGDESPGPALKHLESMSDQPLLRSRLAWERFRRGRSS